MKTVERPINIQIRSPLVALSRSSMKKEIQHKNIYIIDKEKAKNAQNINFNVKAMNQMAKYQ